MEPEDLDGLQQNYEPGAQSFFIDTDGYTQRDREMFVAGYELACVHSDLEAGGPFQRLIHTENASRVRMTCGRAGRRCTIDAITDPAGEDSTWSQLTVE